MWQERLRRYLVVDEGHRLKNFNSKLFRDLRQLQVQQKLLLTGGSCVDKQCLHDGSKALNLLHVWLAISCVCVLGVHPCKEHCTGT